MKSSYTRDYERESKEVECLGSCGETFKIHTAFKNPRLMCENCYVVDSAVRAVRAEKACKTLLDTTQYDCIGENNDS